MLFWTAFKTTVNHYIQIGSAINFHYDLFKVRIINLSFKLCDSDKL